MEYSTNRPIVSLSTNRQLARAQGAPARKREFSTNWKKQKSRITRLHSRIANVRGDYLHKCSHRISQNHAVVCVEALKLCNMSSTASGTKDSPGKRVKAKSGLNRSILDQGWGAFRRQLGYKLDWAGGELVEVPAQYTSQKCSGCGHTAKDNRKSQALFRCVSCGFEDNADSNAAKNIHAAEHAVLACGGDVRPTKRVRVKSAAPMKQEPTEAVQAVA